MARFNGTELIASIYVGYFNRAPDADGLDYWTTALANGISVEEIAVNFSRSAEAAGIYPQLRGSPDRAAIEDFVRDIYDNLLNRAPDTEGFNYWTNQIQQGNIDPSVLILAIINGAQGSDIQTIENKVEVSLAYTAAADLANSFDIPESTAIIADVTFTAASVEDAKNDIREQVYPEGETVTVPGPTTVITVPGPTIDKPDLTTFTHDQLDSQFLNANGRLFQGDGTTQSDGFAIVSDPNTGLTFGIEITPRQTEEVFGGGEYVPFESTFDGTTHHVTWFVPSGSQSTENGSFQNVANRGAINSNVVVGIDDSKAGGLSGFLAAGNVIKLSLDTDNTAAINLVSFNATVGADGVLDFGGFAEFKGNNFVASESIQQNFVTAGGVAALTPGAQFDNYIEAFDANGTLLMRFHEELNLVAPGYSPQDQIPLAGQPAAAPAFMLEAA